MPGPLAGVTVIEFAGIGPGPFTAMMLADMGADVIRVDRATSATDGFTAFDPKFDVLNRGRRSIALDLKQPEALEVALTLLEQADALIEGYRPGVMERLGLGPDVCLARNPNLVYGRMTGWGQDGPYALAAGHDINYIGLAGALAPVGRAGERPVPPVNFVGDFGGGGMLLAFGIACGIVHVRGGGQGQVIDAAMVDGAAALTTMFHGLMAMGVWKDERGVNTLDGGSSFYDTYETADGKYVAIGSVEPQFYALLLEKLGLDGEDLPAQYDESSWPAMKERFAAVFRGRTRDEWCELLEGTDVCFAPVLSMREAPSHPHNVHRGSFVEVEGVVQPAPAPRFSSTPGAIQRPPATPGEHTAEVLAQFGFDTGRIEALRAAGAVV